MELIENMQCIYSHNNDKNKIKKKHNNDIDIN